MKWEYLIRRVSEDKEVNLREKLNLFGQDGWELVQFDINMNVVIFKRLVKPEMPEEMRQWQLWKR